ncbi:MAG: VWA domain-containing protein [Rikenellaceae bacterium]|nr:VWA domain-containing protein [Rikenellaceae bacterium]
MYSQSITRTHRTLIVLALDRSGSMCEQIETPDGPRTKAEAVCEIANSLLFELIERARRSDGVRDYYDIAAIGYSGAGIEPLLTEKWLLSVSELAQDEPRYTERLTIHTLPDGTQSLHRIKRPEWIRPNAAGETPMYALFCQVHDLVKAWCSDPRNRESFPPVVFHITDGEASDSSPDDLREICRAIREEGTQDGNTLLLNCHLTSHTLNPRILFPSGIEELNENRYARLLYDCSSELPAVFEQEICRLKGNSGRGPFRGMSYNCSTQELITLLNIGSISLPVY